MVECVSDSMVMEKHLNGFLLNFQDRFEKIQEQFLRRSRCLGSPSESRIDVWSSLGHNVTCLLDCSICFFLFILFCSICFSS